ncbi:uncharacterized protein [Physcomitrium patens]|uniref:uncharacterized protein isoform X3 n=1 Tax=Physcomitrium patens TaxID=3218 RepID=UPI003CCCA3D3
MDNLPRFLRTEATAVSTYTDEESTRRFCRLGCNISSFRSFRWITTFHETQLFLIPQKKLEDLHIRKVNSISLR